MNTYNKIQRINKRISNLERATDALREDKKELTRQLNAEHIDWAFNGFKQ